MVSANLAADWLRRLGAGIALAASLAGLAAEPPAEETQALTALGARLFADKRLSIDGSVSCATCHAPEKAFADGRRVAIGTQGLSGTRNTPSLLNVGEYKAFTWDGRRPSVDSQVLDPLTNVREHGFSSLPEVLTRISADGEYQASFKGAFPGHSISAEAVSSALAAYVRSVSGGKSRFDRYRDERTESAMEPAARRGYQIFRGRAQCSTCHIVDEGHATFTDDDFHSVGVGTASLAPGLGEAVQRSVRASADELDMLVTSDPAIAALGRFNVTRRITDIGKYRTPSLRNVALTAPYMHDGSVTTLEEAVDLEVYYRGAQQGRPTVLTPQERADLVAFLRALTNEALESPSRNR